MNNYALVTVGGCVAWAGTCYGTYWSLAGGHWMIAAYMVIAFLVLAVALIRHVSHVHCMYLNILREDLEMSDGGQDV